MALKIERQGQTTVSLSSQKPQLCYSCKMRKQGIFDLDPYGQPRCPDCQIAQGAKRP